ncbi:MAG TPA: hypothetical protein VF688_07710 [Allosphingosinicella sp.]|jgi:hypothetical protein
MAKPGTTRRRVLRAAASIPFLPLAAIRAEPVEASAFAPERELWDRNLARYHRLAAQAKKAKETGWFRAANERFYRESANPGADRKAAFARMTRAENLFWHRCSAPMQEAAVALVLTPAPNLEALRAKLTVIHTHQLYEPRSMERDCLEVLKRDVGRLISLSAS